MVQECLQSLHTTCVNQVICDHDNVNVLTFIDFLDCLLKKTGTAAKADRIIDYEKALDIRKQSRIFIKKINSFGQYSTSFKMRVPEPESDSGTQLIYNSEIALL